MLDEVLCDLIRYKIPFDHDELVSYIEAHSDRMSIQVVEHFRCEWIKKSRGVDGFIAWTNKTLIGIRDGQTYQQIYGRMGESNVFSNGG
jgi:hypothetical protein